MLIHNTSMMKEFPYLYRGVVLENNDPKKLGRCKIKVPSIHGDVPHASYLPWARCIASIPIGEGRGNVSIPDIGEVVWVLFEGGNRDFPVYLGGTYGTKDVPINLEELVLYQEKEDRIYYNRTSRNFDIQIGSIHIIVTPDLVNIKGDTRIEGDVKVEGSLHVTGTITSDVDVYGGGVSLKSHTQE